MNDRAKEELKLCPLCGGEAKVEKCKIPNSFVSGTQVGCTTGYYHEGCVGHITYSLFYKNESQAIRAWNERQALAALNKPLVSSDKAKELIREIRHKCYKERPIDKEWLKDKLRHILAALECQTCGGSRKVPDPTLISMGPVPKIPCPDCPPKPEQQSGEFVKELRRRAEARAEHGFSYEKDINARAADTIEQLTQQLREGHHCQSFDMCGDAHNKYEKRIEQLKADTCPSYMGQGKCNKAEDYAKLEAENKQLTEQIAGLEQKGE